jgi:uncharacterized protein (TIGR03118 family)
MCSEDCAAGLGAPLNSIPQLTLESSKKAVCHRSQRAVSGGKRSIVPENRFFKPQGTLAAVNRLIGVWNETHRTIRTLTAGAFFAAPCGRPSSAAKRGETRFQKRESQVGSKSLELVTKIPSIGKNDNINPAIKHLRVLVALTFMTALLPTMARAQHYTQTNLVSNLSGVAPTRDPNLQNAWGLVHGPSTPWWVSNNAGGTSTLYMGTGAIIPLVVTIPNAPSQPAPGSPTAVMFNGSPTDFLLAKKKPAFFLWVTEDGTVQGWNPDVKPTTAVIEVDNSQVPDPTNGAVYKGATIAEIDGKKFILAANFRSGRVDVFATGFEQERVPDDRFHDDRIPHDFAPFNVQGYGPNIYVTYAQQDAARHDPVGGAGLGFVDVFSSKGRLLARLEHGDWFNAPWGVVLTPADFGEFSHTLLIGSFRGGTVAAFNPLTGHFLGNVLNPDGSTLNIDGLWALGFGNGGASGPGNTLFFTAGPDNETNGLFGTLTPIASELNEDDEH